MAGKSDFRIVFEQDGYPRELINSADRERAVRQEVLTPDLEVTVYRVDTPPKVFRARDIEELKPLFGLDPPAPSPAPPKAESVGPAPIPSPPPVRSRPSRPSRSSPPSPPPAAAPSPALVSPSVDERGGFWERDSIADRSAGSGAVKVAAATGRAAPTEAEPAGEEEARSAPSSPEPGKYTFLWVLLAIIGALYLLGTCSTETPRADIDTSAKTATNDVVGNEVSAAAPVEETGPDEVTLAEVASSETRFAVRETNVRGRPTTASPVVGKLGRGASVIGVVIPGVDPEHRWLKITSGDFAGYYVSADANVSEVARPPLDTSFAGAKAVFRHAPLYAEPDRASRILEYAKPGMTLSVVGGVLDGLAEVSLKSGAIAYVEQTTFEAGAADGQDDFDQPAADVAAKDSASAPRVVDLSRPVALQNRDFISASDYPAKSLREDDSGTVGFRVEVTAAGFPIKCRVTRSSGHERLDRATCRLVMERARFDAARDVSGEPMSGLYEGSFTWRLD